MKRTIRSGQKAATCGVVGAQDPSQAVRFALVRQQTFLNFLVRSDLACRAAIIVGRRCGVANNKLTSSLSSSGGPIVESDVIDVPGKACNNFGGLLCVKQMSL